MSPFVITVEADNLAPARRMVVIRDREDTIIQITARNLDPDLALEVLEASKAAFEAGARTLRAVIAESSAMNCYVDYR